MFARRMLITKKFLLKFEKFLINYSSDVTDVFIK